MARARRINLPHTLYHLICRGNKNDPVFLSDPDRRCFLRYLHNYCHLYSFRVHAYCLMDTHVHLLVESKEANLSDFMHRLLTAYTVWFHKHHNTRGHLFSGRFKSIAVQKGRYLLQLSRYIHLNPVEAGIVDRPQDYSWSSMKGYLKPKTSPKFLYTREILGWFGNKPAAYQDFIREGFDEETIPLIVAQRFVGGEPFIQRTLKRMESFADRSQKVHKKETSNCLNKILKLVCDRYNIKPDVFQKKRWKHKIDREALSVFILLARDITTSKFREIGEFSGYSPIHIQNILHNAEKNGKIQKVVDQLERKLTQ